MEEIKKISNDLFLEALGNYRNSIDPVIKLYKEFGKEKEILIEFQDGSISRMDTTETRDRLVILIATYIVEKYRKYNFTLGLWSNPFGYSFHYKNQGFFWKHLAFVWTQHSIPKLNRIEVYDANYIGEANDLGTMTGDDVIIMKW